MPPRKHVAKVQLFFELKHGNLVFLPFHLINDINGSPVIPCVCLTSPNTKTVKTLICTAMLYEGSDAVDERDGHTCLYPIPADVRALNHNLEQNPGY